MGIPWQKCTVVLLRGCLPQKMVPSHGAADAYVLLLPPAQSRVTLHDAESNSFPFLPFPLLSRSSARPPLQSHPNSRRRARGQRAAGISWGDTNGKEQSGMQLVRDQLRNRWNWCVPAPVGSGGGHAMEPKVIHTLQGSIMPASTRPCRCTAGATVRSARSAPHRPGRKKKKRKPQPRSDLRKENTTRAHVARRATGAPPRQL